MRLKKLVPYGGHERKEVWKAYLSHAVYVAGLDDALDDTAKASLLGRVGRCQASLGQYSAAETTHRQVLAFREKSLGQKYPSTLTTMNNLAGVLGR
jgi:hypothetical protein